MQYLVWNFLSYISYAKLIGSSSLENCIAVKAAPPQGMTL